MIGKDTNFTENCDGPYTYPVQAGTSCNDGDYKLASIDGCPDAKKEFLNPAADKGQGTYGRYENECNYTPPPRIIDSILVLFDNNLIRHPYNNYQEGGYAALGKITRFVGGEVL
ncbi:MAG: hypothetical protein LBL21_01515 [Rickettsiales bacterium]|jgi:hypothetical protein|nr:hypothetical protein [Rickettsiales bacterium]